MSHPAKINVAIHEILDSLRPEWLPLAHLKSCLDRLRTDFSWSEDEISEVDCGVRKILAEMVIERAARRQK